MIIENPIICDEIGFIRDPMILPYNGKYYMVATSPQFWEGENPGVRLWVSDNLSDWSFKKLIIDAAKIPKDKPYKDRFWAPELFMYGGKFFCLFSAHNAERTDRDGLRCFAATADSIDGEYKIIEKPIVDRDFRTIDAHLFEDNGKVFLFYSTGGGIYMTEFDPKTCTASDDIRLVISKGEDGEWDATGVEGSFVVKRGGVYYHWYSSWTRGYEMGLAVTDDLKKPFKKLATNPMVSVVGKNTKIKCCGHNSCFRLSDGSDMIAFHASGDGFDESLCISRFDYTDCKPKAPDGFIVI